MGGAGIECVATLRSAAECFIGYDKVMEMFRVAEPKEKLEPVQAHLPSAQVRWLRSKAELHGSSVNAEIKRAVHVAMQVENLAAPHDVHYVEVAS